MLPGIRNRCQFIPRCLTILTPSAQVQAGGIYQGSVPNLNAQGGASLALLDGPWRYLRLVDTSPNVSGRDGFDIDAVSVTPVPLPAAIWMLLAAVGGLLDWDGTDPLASSDKSYECKHWSGQPGRRFLSLGLAGEAVLTAA